MIYYVPSIATISRDTEVNEREALLPKELTIGRKGTKEIKVNMVM